MVSPSYANARVKQLQTWLKEKLPTKFIYIFSFFQFNNNWPHIVYGVWCPIDFSLDDTSKSRIDTVRRKSSKTMNFSYIMIITITTLQHYQTWHVLQW
jgi:hypothetical protein